ncbi:MAG TPA: glycosyltransferase family 1 protein [Acidimicrobiales bacterium]|nr:glycosyltransferase family 1 protein [Acidimicrobiales bacterium]
MSDVVAPPDVVIDADVLGRQRTGDETHVHQLLVGLADGDPGLTVGAVTRWPAMVPEGVTAYQLDPVHQLTRMIWQLPRLLGRIRPRLAHFQYVVPPLYRGRSVVTVHDLSYELLPELEDRFDGWALRRLVPPSIRRSELVFTVSEWTKSDIVSRYGVPPEKIVVTLNGVSDRFTPRGPRPARPPYLLFVGALRPRKDPLAALEAFVRLGEDDLHLVMVGPDRGLRAEVESFVDRSGIRRRVEIKGHVDDDELASLYRGARCVVLPTRYEGFGLPVVEAMASGVPVVSTTAGSIPEVAGTAAVLVPPRDPGALADGIRTALADAPALVAQGLERAARFNWAEVVGRVLEGYRSVLG